MSVSKTASRLGVGHQIVELHQLEPKLWRSCASGLGVGVEDAVLHHLQSQGWSGCNAEGGVFLTLVKAASFPVLPAEQANTFIESLYHWEFGGVPRFECPRREMLKTLNAASLEQIIDNFRVITKGGRSPFYYPNVELSHVLRLKHLMGSKFFMAAEIFAAAPYDFRRGWPDLTVWKGEDLQFLELKAPGDALHKSQRHFIDNMAKPLGLEVAIIEVKHATSADIGAPF